MIKLQLAARRPSSQGVHHRKASPRSILDYATVRDLVPTYLTAQTMTAAAGSPGSPPTRPVDRDAPRSAKRPRQDLLQQRWGPGGLSGLSGGLCR